jgi:hypothetical protein
MLSDEELCRHTAVSPSRTHVTRPEFDGLRGRLVRAEADLRAGSDATRRGARLRRDPHAAADRVLMALLWPCVSPTSDVLDSLNDLPIDRRPTPDRKKARSTAEVTAAFPPARSASTPRSGRRGGQPPGRHRPKS